jgi:hypothetical protein
LLLACFAASAVYADGGAGQIPDPPPQTTDGGAGQIPDPPPQNTSSDEDDVTLTDVMVTLLVLII